MAEEKSVRDTVEELVDNLGTIGLFMFGEGRSLLRRSWGASREEFMSAVDQAARSMKQSGKMAVEDVDRAVRQIKENWHLLDDQSRREWESFLDEVTTRLKAMSTISQETFDLAVSQAKKSIDRQWNATGRIGEDQLKLVQRHTEQMADAFKKQWSVFWDQMEQTGRKVDRAVQAAWEELKKGEEPKDK